MKTRPGKVPISWTDIMQGENFSLILHSSDSNNSTGRIKCEEHAQHLSLFNSKEKLMACSVLTCWHAGMHAYDIY